MVEPTDDPLIVKIVCPYCEEYSIGHLDHPFPHFMKCWACDFNMVSQLELKDYPDIVFING